MRNILFYYIGNCSAIPYIAKKALRATDAHSRDRYMSLTRPRETPEFRKRNSFYFTLSKFFKVMYNNSYVGKFKNRNYEL